MTGLALTLLAFVVTAWQTRRSLAHGLGALLTVGFFYGILRARSPDGFSHFMFDAGLLALYATAFGAGKGTALRTWPAGQQLAQWLRALVAWATLVVFLSPLLDAQPLVIQLVGVRASLLMLPLVALGARLDRAGLDVLVDRVVWLVLLATAFGAAELVLGVERFYPRNSVTDIIYRSSDVGAERALRIPAIFVNAHAYGGTVAATVPLLLRRWTHRPGTWPRILTALALAAAMLSIFLCGARTPVVVLGGALVFALVLGRPSPRVLGGLGLLLLVSGVVVARTPRLQRVLSLGDTASVEERLRGSVNEGLLDIAVEYPLGRGFGSAAGTSVPYFLQDQMRPQVGLESEYSRLALEQGVVGLLLWASFVAWTLSRLPSGTGLELFVRRLSWGYIATCWVSAFTGTGMLTSIPQTALLLLQMGLLVAWRRAEPRPAAVPVAAPAAGLPAPRQRLARPRVAQPSTRDTSR